MQQCCLAVPIIIGTTAIGSGTPFLPEGGPLYILYLWMKRTLRQSTSNNSAIIDAGPTQRDFIINRLGVLRPICSMFGTEHGTYRSSYIEFVATSANAGHTHLPAPSSWIEAPYHKGGHKVGDILSCRLCLQQANILCYGRYEEWMLFTKEILIATKDENTIII